MFGDLVRFYDAFEDCAWLLDNLQVFNVGGGLSNLLDYFFAERLELMDECGVSGDEDLRDVLYCWIFQLVQ